MDYLTDLLFLDRLARSGDPVTREAVELARLRVIHKYGFDPSQPRDITGQWSAGGTTTTVTPSRADAQRQREANAEAAATGRLADARDSAAADAAIRAATPETPKGATQAAVDAAKKKYGIPSPSKLKRLSAARQAAAKEILDATRDLVRLQQRQAKLQARLDAIRRELGKEGRRPKTVARLNARLAATKADLEQVAKDAAGAQSRLAAGRRAWSGKK